MKIRDSHPNLKIILSEITPRFDSLDKDVLHLNAKIFNSIKACENKFVVHHNILQKEEFYYDNKHLKKDHIHHLASNMKFGMRKVLGIRFLKSTGMMPGDHRDKHVDNPARKYASLRKLDKIRHEKAGRHEKPRNRMNNGQNDDTVWKLASLLTSFFKEHNQI